MKFPETDAQGRKLRRTYQFTLSGTNHKHDGVVPEQILNQSMVGDPVMLVWDEGNRYDPGAVKVLWNGKYIGWLPSRELEDVTNKKAVLRRLHRGMVVPACITSVHSQSVRAKEDGEWVDVMTTTADVEVAAYEIKRAKGEDTDQIEIEQPLTTGKAEPNQQPAEKPEGSSTSGYGCAVVFVLALAAIVWFLVDKFFGIFGL